MLEIEAGVAYSAELHDPHKDDHAYSDKFTFNEIDDVVAIYNKQPLRPQQTASKAEKPSKAKPTTPKKGGN